MRTSIKARVINTCWDGKTNETTVTYEDAQGAVYQERVPGPPAWSPKSNGRILPLGTVATLKVETKVTRTGYMSGPLPREFAELDKKRLSDDLVRRKVPNVAAR